MTILAALPALGTSIYPAFRLGSEFMPTLNEGTLFSMPTSLPGMSITMPIKAHIDMLSTGIRTPIGIKVFGKDLDEMEQLAKAIETVVKAVPGTSSAFAERITGGFYLNIEPDRE